MVEAEERRCHHGAGGSASPKATPDIGVQSYPWRPSANIALAKRGWVHSAPGELAMQSGCKSHMVKV